MRRSEWARLPWLIPAISCLFFVLAGLALIPWPGLQNDELFFAGPIYDPNAAFYYAKLGAIRIPLMVVSYTGALKTWLYAALLTVIEPSPWTIRIPVLLAGAVTIWLTWSWMRRAGSGIRAAAIATVLLATDTSYLLTSTFDWGPVVLQHLLLMSGLAALQIWISRESRAALAAAFFFWGLGLWDKALLLWPLSGLGMACILVYRREAFRRVRPANVGIAVVFFAIGASPLIWYNIARPGETAAGNVSLSEGDIHLKLKALRESVDGSSMFGFMVYEDGVSGKRAATGPLGLLSTAIKSHLGTYRRNWMPVALVLAFFCLIAQWRSPAQKPLLFLGITMAVAWLEMVWNKGTGVFVHHVILLWPFPFAFIGIAFSAASQRLPRGQVLLVILMVLLVARNLLTANEYLAELITNGGMGGWTDAIYGLSDAVDNTRARWVGLVDWGCLNDLRLLDKRDAILFGAGDPVMSDRLTPETQEAVKHMATTPDAIFIQHVEDKQMFPGVNGRFRKAALQAGFREKIKRVIPDRNGRPVFEIFSFGNDDH